MIFKKNPLLSKYMAGQGFCPRLGLLVILGASLGLCPSSFGQAADNQQGPANQLNFWMPPQTQPKTLPAPSPQYQRGYLPQFTPDFWKGNFGGNGSNGLPRYLNMGTVFTGYLTEKLSSKSSKDGDVFAILMPEGYVENGEEIIPQGSKIIGTVLHATPAQSWHHGMPGNLSVGLQTLVLPDGSSTPIYGFIEKNPNLEIREGKNKSTPASSTYHYGQKITGSVVALANGITHRGTGMSLIYPNSKGMEFVLDKGEMVAVRLNRPLDVSAILAHQPANAANQITSGPGCHCASGLSASALRDLGVPGLIPQEGMAPSPTTPKF